MEINLKEVHFDRQFDFLDFSMEKMKIYFLIEAIRWNGKSRSIFSQGHVNKRGFKSSFRVGYLKSHTFILEKKLNFRETGVQKKILKKI